VFGEASRNPFKKSVLKIIGDFGLSFFNIRKFCLFRRAPILFLFDAR